MGIKRVRPWWERLEPLFAETWNSKPKMSLKRPIAELRSECAVSSCDRDWDKASGSLAPIFICQRLGRMAQTGSLPRRSNHFCQEFTSPRV